MSVTLVGTGCGSLDNMTVEVRQALLEADLIIGAKRLIEGFPAEYTAESPHSPPLDTDARIALRKST